ncbi:MAG: metallophosphoesterase family protein [Alphaproteobacteria bacterium]
MTGHVVRLTQITDCHVTAGPDVPFAGVDPLARLEAVLRHIAAGPSPDAVLATGDLVAEGTDTEYRRLAPALAAIGPPVFVVPGNHDVGATLDRHLLGATVRRQPAWTVGSWRVLFLDSTVPGHMDGTLGPQRLAELDRTLAADGVRPTLVVVHHNPVATGGPADDCPLTDGVALFDTLDRHDQVRGVLWGHIHAAFDAQRRGVRLMGTPSSAVQFPVRPGSLAWIEDAPGYRRLALHPDGRIETEVVWVRAG